VTYLITFACYGAHLHGDEAGSVDRNHNVPGDRTLDADAERVSRERNLMDQAPYILNAPGRSAVLDSIREVCLHRQWALQAAHVRTTHVHVVVDAEEKPEKLMNAFKSYASRRWNQACTDGPDGKRWARHGSTRWLRSGEDVRAAMRYVVDGQGEAMAVFVAPTDPRP
jgi:REP element-mobilizing transposase RayT